LFIFSKKIEGTFIFCICNNLESV